jgi:hypothetical protein
MKTSYIHALYRKNPVFLPVFSFLVTWARNAGIVKYNPEDSALMPTAEFYAFILKMLSDEDLPEIEREEFVLLKTEDLQTFFDDIFDRVKKSNKDILFIDIGQLILKFFRKASVLQVA